MCLSWRRLSEAWQNNRKITELQFHQTPTRPQLSVMKDQLDEAALAATGYSCIFMISYFIDCSNKSPSI